jgi:hypothetical protein
LLDEEEEDSNGECSDGSEEPQLQAIDEFGRFNFGGEDDDDEIIMLEYN